MKSIHLIIFIIVINIPITAQSVILLPRQHLSFSVAGGISIPYTDYVNGKPGFVLRSGIEYSIFPHPDHRIGLGFQFGYQQLNGEDDRLVVSTKDGPRNIPPAFSTTIISPGFFSNYSYLFSDRFSIFGRLGFTYNVFNPKDNLGNDAVGYKEGLYNNDFFTVVPEAGFNFRISQNIGVTIALNFALPVTDYLDDISAPLNEDSYSNILLELSYSFIDAAEMKATSLFDGVRRDTDLNSISDDQGDSKTDFSKIPPEIIDSHFVYKPIRQIIDEIVNINSFNEILIPGDELFQSGTTRFRHVVYYDLDRLAELLNADPRSRWRIEGHMDNQGDPSAIKKLSWDRARAVYDYFFSKGIAPGRLRVYGLADDFPIASNISIEGQRMNRRIMIIRETYIHIADHNVEQEHIINKDTSVAPEQQYTVTDEELTENKNSPPVEVFDQFILRGDDTFESNSADLKEAAKFLLNEIVNYLKNQPGSKWKIEGYMDNQGSENFLKKLSADKAKSIQNYFISQGLSPEQFSYEGFGSDAPIANNNSDEGRSTNRRILIIRMD